MIDVIEASFRAQIAFGVLLIASLLTYIAFFKDKVSKSHKHPRNQK